jgi:hypothetical protein
MPETASMACNRVLLDKLLDAAGVSMRMGTDD